MKIIKIGKGRLFYEIRGTNIAILTIGPILKDAIKAAESLKSKGVNTDIYDMIWVKPLDVDLLKHIASSHKAIVTVEDGVTTGGFGTAVTEWCRDNGIDIIIHTLGAPDSWVAHGTVTQLRHDCGYDSAGIEAAVTAVAGLKS